MPIHFLYYPQTIRVTSHSKDLSLPGERIGYIAVSPLCEGTEELIAALIFDNRTLRFVNAPALMQRLVAPLQRNSIKIREYEEKRDLLYNALRSLGYQVVKPQGAFYLFPKAPIEDDVVFVKELQSKRILTVPGRGFGKSGYFRIAYAVDKKVMLIVASLLPFAFALLLFFKRSAVQRLVSSLLTVEERALRARGRAGLLSGRSS